MRQGTGPAYNAYTSNNYNTFDMQYSRLQFIAISLLLLCVHASRAQTVSASLPKNIDKNAHYLFYLHGGVVTALGDNGISRGAPEWGPYEYSNILASLRERGFYVVSERRFEDVKDSLYAAKICTQIKTLFQAGVPVQNILVVSASAGWTISYRVSERLRNDSLHFVKMGGCWPDDYKEVEKSELYGKFLSIIEKSDPHGSCNTLFQMKKTITDYKEIVLNTGLSHGFFFKARNEWIEPLLKWFDNK